MKYNVPSQKRPCLHANEIRSTPCILWIGVFEWSNGVEFWVKLTGAIFFPRPLPGFGGISNFIL